MSQPITTRREFLAVTGAAAAGLMIAGRADAAKRYRTKLYRAMTGGKPDEGTLKALKEAGFDGFETNAIVSEDEAKASRELAEKIGLRIHSVLIGGGNLEKLQNALTAAKGYGADAVLFVPAYFGGVKMPEPWEFDVKFDRKTGHIKQLVAGDSTPFQAYIEGHNRCTDQAVALVKQAVPLAEKLQVAIALENVWNSLWVKPELFCNLVDLCGSPYVKAYFDVGNHMKYQTPPEQWIRLLGKRLAKVHIKDWKYTSDDHHQGTWAHPRDGSVNWPAVRDAFEAVRYSGYLTVEDGGLPLSEFRQRLDDIIAGR